MAKLYKHQDEVEQRMFAYDINSLKQRSEEFKTAWDSNSKLEFTITLQDIFEACPRKYCKSESYIRLAKYLLTRQITLVIISRKKKK